MYTVNCFDTSQMLDNYLARDASQLIVICHKSERTQLLPQTHEKSDDFEAVKKRARSDHHMSSASLVKCFQQ